MRRRIACVGDSITWGFTIRGRKYYSYPAVLQKLLGPSVEVGNFGFPDTSAGVGADHPYKSYPAFLPSLGFAPDTVLLMLGTNDTKEGNWSREGFREGYEDLIDSYGRAEVLLLLPPPIYMEQLPDCYPLSAELLDSEVIPSIKEIAARRGLRLLDIHSLLSDPSLIPDGVHPSEEGADKIAHYCASFL